MIVFYEWPYIYLFTVLQYGRQNIENVKKKNGTRDLDEDLGTEEESPTITEHSSTITSLKAQNGCVGNSVIARSKDLILVPEPDAHNHKNHVDEANLTNDQTSTIDDKEVNLYGTYCIFVKFLTELPDFF